MQILKTKWWKYLLMGLADVEANYTVVKAYQFTTLTSIQVREIIWLHPAVCILYILYIYIYILYYWFHLLVRHCVVNVWFSCWTPL